MGTKVNVIITKNSVYATYFKTICYKGSFENREQRDEELKSAQSVAFSYACNFSSVLVDMFERLDFSTDKDIFDYLERTNK